MAQEVDSLLVQYTGALRELVERSNRETCRRGDDALEVVRSILDSQMAALAYVDREAAKLVVDAQHLDRELERLQGKGGGYYAE